LALSDWIPPLDAQSAFAHNGYARLSDLEQPAYAELIRRMEGFQAEFLARTRPVWNRDFPIPGDALAHFSRQWEYPYAWANLSRERGRVLDAGSGITFFPFLLAAAGFDVECCDADDELGLEARYEQACMATALKVAYSTCELSHLPHPDGAFDSVVCISVVEHLGDAAHGGIRSLARVLRPGGRIVITWDVDLRRNGGILVEDVSLLLAEIDRQFELVHPLDLRRPLDLLTSDAFLAAAPWRLPPPWQPLPGLAPGSEFASIAVLGLTGTKRDA
jgi:SAM-dependent methyltransferase